MRAPVRYLLVALVLFPAAGRSQLSLTYEKFTLPNGLQVIFHEDHTLPLVSVNTYYHVGSGHEKPGRTGFAHLFEHLMFEGSANVPEGKFDEWLEAAGGNNNGSTNSDRTNYWEDSPSNALELGIFLEADRMGGLLATMSPAKVDGQRDVVKNERRQSYENRPYGMAEITISENLFPPNHPYHWPTIGSMADLSAASYEDVVEFFRTYYVPNNASVVIAGDIDPVKTRELVTKWFGPIPAGNPVPPIDPPVAFLAGEKRSVMEDKVQLPRLYMCWLTPAAFTPGDAEMDLVAGVLTGGKNSRLYKRLVYELQIAQDVSAGQGSRALGSYFSIEATAKAGHTLGEIEKIIHEEIETLRKTPPDRRELARTVNGYESSFLARLQGVGGFGGKADLLNSYFTRTGNPDYLNEDFSRYKAITPDDITAAVQKYLREDGRVILSVVPEGKPGLASPGKGGAR
ncbi:MAG TPA: pitrilysin family protein [Bacteroidota bacterium]|nr:pitrilysin family protein [Bacteroidota bacterium]